MFLREIARKNFQRQWGRSFCLVIVIMLLSFFLFIGSVLSLSLSNGAESMANRLGADVMIVPEGYDPHVDSILLAGSPSTFYLPDYALNEIENLKNELGIDLISPQTFLATLRASCCSYPVQIVGIDYDSDFIIGSWLKESTSWLRHIYCTGMKGHWSERRIRLMNQYSAS